MRRIEILDDLHLNFPGRDAEFDLGLEIGALAVRMAQGELTIRRILSQDCVEQIRPIAERFGYALVATPVDGGLDTCLTHARLGRRPRLQVVG